MDEKIKAIKAIKAEVFLYEAKASLRQSKGELEVEDPEEGKLAELMEEIKKGEG